MSYAVVDALSLDAAELEEPHALLRASTDASDDEQFVCGCGRIDGLIVADLYRRELVKASIDAKAAAIVAQERRLACLTRPDGLFAG